MVGIAHDSKSCNLGGVKVGLTTDREKHYNEGIGIKQWLSGYASCDV